MSSTVHRRGTPWALLAAILTLVAAAAALLPASARAATTTATITLKSPLVSPGLPGGFGRYNIAISNLPGGTVFPFLGGDKRAHCVEFDQGAATGAGILNSGADIALRGHADTALGNARVKWLVLSSYQSESEPGALSAAQQVAAHQSAIWALTNPTQGAGSLGDPGNVRDPGDAAAFQRAKDLYAFVAAPGFSADWVDRHPSVSAKDTSAVCAGGGKRTVVLKGAAWTKATVTVPAGASVWVDGVERGTSATVLLDGDGQVEVQVTKATAGTVTVSVAYKKPFMVQSRNGPSKTNQDFVYLEWESWTKTTQVDFLDCKPLTVAKTATPTYTRTFSWDVAKTAGVESPILTTADQVSVPYTVTVTRTGQADSGFTVAGQVTVTNPNAFAVTDVDVTDQIQGGPACVVSGGLDNIIQPGGQLVLDYTCSLGSATDGVNKATVTWDRPGLPDGQATGTAPFDFTDPTTIVGGSVVVTDTAPQLAAKYGSPVVVGHTDPTPAVFTYDRVLDVPAGLEACTVYDNTARIAFPEQEPFDSASASVTVCRKSQGLVVTKTATPSYTRTFDWTITKSATPATQTVGTDSATVGYEVVVTRSAPVDSDFRVTGKITLTNPNPFPVSGVTVTDELPGATCQVAGGPLDVPARTGGVNGTATVDYTCTRSDKVDGTNTATATWTWTPQQALAVNGEPGPQTATGTAPVVFGAPATVVNDAVDVLDAFNGGAPEVLATGLAESRTFTYQRTVATPAAGACATFPNVASVVSGSFRRDAAAEAAVCRPSAPPVTPAGTTVIPVRPVPRARLSIDKRGPARATAGQLVPYTITVRNTGRAAARRVVITDTLPAQMTLARRTGGVRMSGGRLTWRVGTLAAGRSRTVTVQLRLDSQARGSRCNVAQATAQNAARVSDSVCTRVTPIAGRVQPAVTG